jgi:hypothetical protein
MVDRKLSGQLSCHFLTKPSKLLNLFLLEGLLDYVLKLIEFDCFRTMAGSDVSFFDEKSGVVAVKTEFGRWWQTVFEVHIEVQLPPDTRGKQCKVELTPSEIHVAVKGETIIKASPRTINICIKIILNYFRGNCSGSSVRMSWCGPLRVK